MGKKHNTSETLTLSIDIGGTRVKMMVLDEKGKPVTKRLRDDTPHPATVDALCEVLHKLILQIDIGYDRVSAGFPGVVLNGIVKTAANLDPSWIGVSLEEKLNDMTGKPTRVANDADVQGYGNIEGKGLELVITLGTGVGTAMFIHGVLVPNLEFGHHPFMDNLSYEELLSEAKLLEIGKEQWCLNLKRAIQTWSMAFNYDYLYIGGGHSELINFILPENVKITENIEGILGGIKLWET